MDTHPAFNSYYEKLADGEIRCIDNEIPFEIPHGWTWCRLEHITNYIQRGKSPKYSLIKRIPVVAQKCNQWSGFQIENAQFIDPETLKSYSNERFLQDGDLMWNSTGLGTLGHMVIYRTDLNPYGIAVADSHVTVIRPFSNDISSEYLYAYFSSLTVQLVIEEKADGSTKQKELSTNTVKSYLVPLPPTDEQVRIVDIILHTKPIIDRYGNLYEHFTSVNNNLNTELRKSILQEAIQGRFVPHIESEGTAEQLLEEIEAEKMRLVKEGKLKKSALTASRIFRGDDNRYRQNIDGEEVIIDDKLPFEIPDTWRWIQLGDMFLHNTGKALNGIGTTGSLRKYITTSNVYWNSFDFSKIKEMRFTDSELEKCTVTKNDILVCEGGDIGRTAIWLYDYEVCIQNHIHRLRPIVSIEPMFFYYVMRLYKYMGLIGGKGIGIQGLSSGALHRIIIPLPPIQEQRRIVDKIESVAGIMSR